MSIADSIKRKFNKQGSGGAVRLDDEDSFVFIHHAMMREYGWIPIDEFKRLPIPTVWNLLDCIRQEKQAEADAMKKNTPRGRR